MLAKVILLKKSWKTVASAANYVIDDLKKNPEPLEPGSYQPEDVANYLAREGVLEAASFNLMAAALFFESCACDLRST